MKISEIEGEDRLWRDWFDFECEDHDDVHMEIGMEASKSQQPKSVWLCDCGLRLIVDFLYI